MASKTVSEMTAEELARKKAYERRYFQDNKEKIYEKARLKKDDPEAYYAKIAEQKAEKSALAERQRTAQREVTASESKSCTKCRETKLACEFYWDSYRNRLNSQCKACRSIARRKRHKAVYDPVKSSAYEKRRWQRLKEDPVKYHQRLAQVAARKRKIRETNGAVPYSRPRQFPHSKVRFAKCAICGEAFRKNGSTNVCSEECKSARIRRDRRDSKLRREAKIRDALCDCRPRTVREFLIAEYGDKCFYCPGPFEHVDHFVPLANGGLHCVGNLVPACALCNVDKGALLVSEWAGWNGAEPRIHCNTSVSENPSR